jgi:hypothetical protein
MIVLFTCEIEVCMPFMHAQIAPQGFATRPNDGSSAHDPARATIALRHFAQQQRNSTASLHGRAAVLLQESAEGGFGLSATPAFELSGHDVVECDADFIVGLSVLLT